MAALTLEQKRALALAAARKRAIESASARAERGHDVPEFDPHVEGYDPKTGEVTKPKKGMLSSAASGAADVATFGFGDEMASVVGSALTGEDQGRVLKEVRANQKKAFDDNPGSYIAGGAAAGIAQGGWLASAGLSAGARAAAAGSSLARTAGGAAIDGAVMGAINGAGSGEGVTDRLIKAGAGTVAGGVIGGAAPLAVAGLSSAFRPVGAMLTSRFRPDHYADAAIGQGLKRAGMTADDVARELELAAADGQDMFTAADAMGHAGRRMLSTVVRNPNDARQEVVDALVRRQMGQGERLSSALAEGFDAPDTAMQRTAALTAARRSAADAGYSAAREGAGVVDVSGALRRLDDTLTPGVNQLVNPGSGIANDSVEGALTRVRSMLTDGRSTLSDFSAVLRVKQDVDDMIDAATRGGRGNQARLLSQVRDEIDNALAAASEPYAAARNTFRADSRVIDAVDEGTRAASGRTRATDNIARFSAMPEREQNAFRAGYVDPQIARVEASAVSPSTNKARMLITEKTGQEFPAFAAPGRADQMGNRIAREQRMFETANAALGGSKTADNLADAADMAQFDPTIISKLARGKVVDALMAAITRGIDKAGGMSTPVIQRIAKSLMETNPDLVRQIMARGAKNTARSATRRAVASAIITNLGAGAVPRSIP